MECVICGVQVKKSDWSNAVLCSNECYEVNFWNNCLDDKAIIIDGVCYHDGGNTPNGHREHLGLGGTLYKIKMNNGEIIETNNLWYNGKVPAQRNIKDNATFIKSQPSIT